MRIHNKIVGATRVVLGAALALYKSALLRRHAASLATVQRAVASRRISYQAYNLCLAQEGVAEREYTRVRLDTEKALKEVGF